MSVIDNIKPLIWNNPEILLQLCV